MRPKKEKNKAQSYLWLLRFHSKLHFTFHFQSKFFPISCGHTKCIFTGKSSKTLRDILMNIDEELQSEEEFQEAENKGFEFLNDVKVEIEKISNTPFEYILVGSV